MNEYFREWNKYICAKIAFALMFESFKAKRARTHKI